MPSARRRVFLNAATVASLVLCLATTVLWLCNVVVVYRWPNPSEPLTRTWAGGWYGTRFAIGAGHSTGDQIGAEWYRITADDIDWSAASFDRMGFVFVNNRFGWGVGIPGSIVPLAFATLPGVRAARAVRRRHHTATGRCAHCGYDLRATPDRCPECGTIPA